MCNSQNFVSPNNFTFHDFEISELNSLESYFENRNRTSKITTTATTIFFVFGSEIQATFWEKGGIFGKIYPKSPQHFFISILNSIVDSEKAVLFEKASN